MANNGGGRLEPASAVMSPAYPTRCVVAGSPKPDLSPEKYLQARARAPHRAPSSAPPPGRGASRAGAPGPNLQNLAHRVDDRVGVIGPHACAIALSCSCI